MYCFKKIVLFTCLLVLITGSTFAQVQKALPFASKARSAFQKQEISYDEYLRHSINRFKNKDAVPLQFRDENPDGHEVTLLARDAVHNWESLSVETRAAFSSTLNKPIGEGTLSGTLELYETTNFSIHFSTTGDDAPSLTDVVGPNGAAGADTVPDYINKTGDFYEASRTEFVTNQGYAAPISDAGTADIGSVDNPNAKFDVFVLSLPGLFGFASTIPETTSGNSVAAFMGIANGLTDSELSQTVDHEFHHAIQFAMAQFADSWYAEATATFVEMDLDTTNTYGYAQLVTYFNNTNVSLGDISAKGGYQYYLFNEFIDDTVSGTAVRSIWQNLITSTSSTSTDVFSGINSGMGGTLASDFLTFAQFNLDTSQYNDAGVAGVVLTPQENASVGADGSVTMTLNHLAAHYTRFTSSGGDETLFLLVEGIDGSTTQAFLMTENGTTFTRTNLTVSGGKIETSVTSFDTTTAVYLVVCNTSSTVDSQAITVSYSSASAPTETITTTPTTTPTSSGGSGPAAADGSGGCLIQLLK